jgi:hypothetical protein
MADHRLGHRCAERPAVSEQAKPAAATSRCETRVEEVGFLERHFETFSKHIQLAAQRILFGRAK